MPWTRRSLLRSAGAAGIVGCGHPPPPGGSPGARRPNVVYLYADQHRAPILGSYGHPVVQTPHLDALAAESIRYPNMFTNSPLCRPSRVAMMTGRLAHVTGSWNNQLTTDRSGPSHVRRIRDEAGYYTAIVGKAHLEDFLSTISDESLQAMGDWGFDHVFELVSQTQCVWTANPYSRWLTESTPSGQPSKSTRYNSYVAAWDMLSSPGPDVSPWRLETSDHLDLYCADRAADWIRSWDGSKPFYLQVNFPGPHSPFDATTEYRDRYDPNAPGFPTSILGAPEEPRSRLVDFLWRQRPELHGLTANASHWLLMTYFAKVTLIDDAVGRVLAALEERGLLDDTWIVYGSDHGDLLGDHELWGKVAFYEGAIRVPLLVRPPGGIAPWTSEGMVDQLDVTATLLELTGLEPDGDGESRLAQWLGGPGGPEAQRGKDSVLAEVAGEWDGTLRNGMVRRADYKFVWDFDNERPAELYDLVADPEERENRFQDPDLIDVVADMRDELLDTIAAQSPGFTG